VSKIVNPRAWLVILCGFAMPIPGIAAPNEGFYVPSRWFRTTEQLPIQVNDNTIAEWNGPLEAATKAWNQSKRIDSPLLRGFLDPAKCSGVSGTIQFCSGNYGLNGWLGVARITISGDYIVHAEAKLNDSYFGDSSANENMMRQWLICRQLGHAYGLTLRSGNNAGAVSSSCMQPLTSDPPTSVPDDVDMQNLVDHYAERDSFANSVGDSFRDAAGGLNEPEIIEDLRHWGVAVHHDTNGQPDVFEKTVTPSRKTVTMVVWANVDTKLTQR
jgi:hypothetical protein